MHNFATVFVVVHHSSLYQYFFYQSTMVPTLVGNSKLLFEYLVRKFHYNDW